MTRGAGRGAIAQYEATVVLVVVSLALASVVYQGMRGLSRTSPEPVFVEQVTLIGGAPGIERVVLNSSSATTVSSLSVDSAASGSGILELGVGGYAAAAPLCGANVTTFFSVLAPEAGTLEVSSDGLSWVSGTWGSAVHVSPGWNEVMIQDAATCSLSLPGGATVQGGWTAQPGPLSSVPVEGPLSGTGFTFFIPTGDGAHAVLIATDGGFARVEI
ncbi:MAG: hypothetical protein JRN58_02285 [Nitrososphaerota archaeon]|nr:hypothetical protein [Nitrososphaerota archaeon]